jgi:phosphoribosylglycinamide formyltransferase-1
MNVAVLVSGGGTNLQALIDYEKSRPDCPYHIVLVVSNTKHAYALERAAAAGIPAEIRSPVSVLGKEKAAAAGRDEKRLAVSDAVLALCREYHADAIVLAGYLSVLGGAIIEEYKDRIVNLHPALLPKFGGVGMWGHNVHEAVLAAHETESGCTVHLVDSGCDTGHILVQKKVPVLPDDTPDSLYARIAPHEHDALIEGVCLLAAAIGC